MLLAVIAVAVLLGVFLIAMYNSLVQLRVRSESAWSDIDVQAQTPSRSHSGESGRNREGLCDPRKEYV